jgi:uncharacterized membrane protein
MGIVLRAAEFLGLSIWLGSDMFLSFVVAPGAFAVLASRDQAGAIVGYSLTRMHWMGIVCGVVILLVRLARTRSVGSLAAPAALCVLVMMVFTVISQVAVSSNLAVLRVQMGSIQATAEGSPLLTEFARLHRVSVGLESGVLLAGMAALILMVSEIGRG